MLERASRSSDPRTVTTPDALLSVIVVGILGMSMFASINAVKLGVAGVPLRALLGPVALAVTLLLRPTLLAETIVLLRRPLLIVALFMVLGIGVSLLAHNPVVYLIQQIVEIHVQALISLCVTGVAIRLVGPRWVAVIFLISFAFSAAMGLLQFAHVGIGWQARAFIGNLTGDPAITREFYTARFRALGMAYNPVILGTQATVAFAAFFGYRLWTTAGGASRGFDWQILIAWGVCALTCVASGNRSPLLGFALFLAIYVSIVMPRMMVIAGPVAILLLAGMGGALDYLASLGLRVASTSDSSAEGRATLFAFGWRLFLDRPMGYGLVFNSYDFGSRYAWLVLHMENPMVIRSYTLHNFFMLMLTKYGIGAVLLAPLAIPFRRSGWLAFLGFVPYIAHITFHNEGPLQSDFLIWYVLPIFIPVVAMLEAQRPVDPTRQPGRWRAARRQPTAA